MIMGFTKPIEHSILLRKKVIFINPLYVGIDVSSKSNVVYLMLPNGDKHWCGIKKVDSLFSRIP